MKLNILLKNLNNIEKNIILDINIIETHTQDDYINKINILNIKKQLLTYIFKIENNNNTLKNNINILKFLNIDDYKNNKCILDDDKINNFIFKIDNKPISCISNIFLYLKNNNYIILNNEENGENGENNKLLNIEWKYKLNGGFILDLIKALLAIFKLFVMIPKFFLWVIRILIWMIKFMIYLVKILIQLVRVDGIMGIIKFFVNEIILFPIRLIFDCIRWGFEKIQYVIEGAFIGVDNVVLTKHKKLNSRNIENEDLFDNCEDENNEEKKTKIYKTEEGTLPFSVIILTVLCPPIGVFIEYGVLGWHYILICAALTLAFYFPGLIYALILLYC